MDKQRAYKWIQALRSGDYQQTSHYLNRDGKFCCWGVACELAVQDGEYIEKRPALDAYGDIIEYDNERGCPPDQVNRWLGLDLLSDAAEVYDEQIHKMEIQTHLMRMNDRGVPFDFIAAYIQGWMNAGF